MFAELDTFLRGTFKIRNIALENFQHSESLPMTSDILRQRPRDTLNKTGQSRVVFTGAVLLKYFSSLGVPR